MCKNWLGTVLRRTSSVMTVSLCLSGITRCGELGYTKQTSLSSAARYMFVHVTKYESGYVVLYLSY